MRRAGRDLYLTARVPFHAKMSPSTPRDFVERMVYDVFSLS
jgi:hypothetical protein